MSTAPSPREPDKPALSPEALLEALIFASPRPVSADDLAAATGLSPEEIAATLAALDATLAERGLRLQRQRQRVQLVTAPAAASYVEDLLGLDVELRLTQAALETLAIIAYAQPVTRPQIEAIRGVGSDSVVRTLLSAGMIEDLGRADTLGRPILYGTTPEFLQQFGLDSPEALPPLDKPDEAPDAPPGAPATA